MFWDEEMETLPRDELKRLQVERLRQTLVRASRSPFYSRLFKRIKLDPEKVSSLDVLKDIPFTTKEDLRSNAPYGFLAVPKEEIIRVHSSSGTTGAATPILYTRSDIDRWADLVARCMYMTGVRKGDVFQNTMGYGLFTGGLGFHYGAEKLGVMVIPSGPGNSKRQIYLMRTFGTTVIHILPSYALRLLSTFEELGLDPKEDTQLRIAFIGAEPHTEEMRRRIEEAYGVDAYNSYGLSEMNGPGVAFECPHKNGMHVWEDSFILEVVDPETLEPVPEGEVGELVFTTLTREGMPIIRYRSRDLAAVYPDPCPCGRTHRRISRIMGRTDDMLIVKGVNIFPMQIEKVLMSIPEVGTDYQIVLERENYMDKLIVRVEINAKFFEGDVKGLERLRRRIIEELRSEIVVTPEVELLEPGSLPKAEGKAVRVIDRRG
ncbi:phenylacetate--CoA ligase [Candidatus Poribacteria bacterium]|nr:MAG: phenylacetate--CoA ligase [Candidatus Poribacteria bacterium]